MNLYYALLFSFIAGLSTVIGMLFTYIKPKNTESFISYCLGISLSVMIMISIFDLIPNALTYMKDYVFLKVILLLFTGYLIINVLNKFLNNQNSLYKLGLLNFIALMIHNFPEGILTFMSTYQNISMGLSITLAIMLHNIPEGIAIAVPIYYAKGSRKEALKMVILSSLSEPGGALIAYLLFRNYMGGSLISIVLLLVAGIMITISIEEILPTALKYKKEKPVLYGIITGLILTALLLI